MRRIFIDPGSKSSGWAIFNGKTFIKSGTVTAESKEIWWKRNKIIYQGYEHLVFWSCHEYKIKFGKYLFDEVHIEQLFRNTHIITHYSVDAITQAVADHTKRVATDTIPHSWEKFVDWNGKRRKLNGYKKQVKSEDELAAIGMGLYYLKDGIIRDEERQRRKGKKARAG